MQKIAKAVVVVARAQRPSTFCSEFDVLVMPTTRLVITVVTGVSI
jgi:hypothetical protein